MAKTPSSRDRAKKPHNCSMCAGTVEGEGFGDYEDAPLCKDCSVSIPDPLLDVALNHDASTVVVGLASGSVFVFGTSPGGNAGRRLNDEYLEFDNVVKLTDKGRVFDQMQGLVFRIASIEYCYEGGWPNLGLLLEVGKVGL